MENSHDSDRQYILAKDDIIKISKLYGSRFIIITSKIAPAITLEYKDAEAAYGEMLKSIKNLEFIHDDQNVITLPRDIIRDYIDREKFINEIPCDSEGRELATLNQNASKANDNW